MKFSENDKVTLLFDKQYGNIETIKAGTKGIVTAVFPGTISYMIKFDSAKMEHQLAEEELSGA